MEESQMIKLVIDSRLENVFLVGLAVQNYCTYLSFNDVEAYQIQLCAVEAANNAILHAYQSQQGHEVEVNVAVFPDGITLEICDTGKIMGDLKSGGRDIDLQNPESLSEDGRGLYLIQTVMDDVSYRSVDGKNILKMIKYFKDR